MPFIDSKVNVKVSATQEKELKARLGKAIKKIPGKSEQWLMCAIEGGCHLYFRGEGDKPIAFINVKIYGSEQPRAFDAMTGELTKIFTDVLGIDPDHIYIAYQPISSWGWNGSNF